MAKLGPLWTTILLVSAIGTAQARPVEISGGLESRFSDNVRQSHRSPKSDLENRVNVQVSHQADPGRCNSSLAARLGWGHWLDSSYDPELYTNISFLGDCQLTQRLYWDLSNDTRDVVQDSRGGDNPDNSTRKNVFRTGPRYQVQLSPIDLLTLSAQFENTEFDDPAERDSNRVIGSAGWNHLFTESFSGGIRLSMSKAELDSGEEIDKSTASLTFNKQWAATSLSGSVGASKIETEFRSNTSSSDALVGDLMLNRDINASTSIYLQASRQLTDRSSDFDIIFQGFVFSFRQSNAVEVTSIRSGLNKIFSNGSVLTVSPFADRSDYLGTNEQDDAVGISARYSRPVNQWLTAYLSGQYVARSYASDDTDDRIASINAGLGYELTRKASLRASIGRTQKSSDVASREYNENTVVVGISYKFR
ncbi:outer membrane beta-barrel protein [Marinobacter sp. X15-166B]|uniref:outer membrane beta-barrel protein n=1 Tax=Marinobacter sp. X15-166B TaxID=1897620 RepID=UPI00085C495C|nr:outer membrane beta-barrel protein [Marinobacter sp. X15-166B]OEY67760.1 hypothetical protein BG841_15875 [Marinobacter sp. X15-166B]